VNFQGVTIEAGILTLVAVLSYNKPGAAVAPVDGRGWLSNRFVVPLAVFPPLVPTR